MLPEHILRETPDQKLIDELEREALGKLKEEVKHLSKAGGKLFTIGFALTLFITMLSSYGCCSSARIF